MISLRPMVDSDWAAVEHIYEEGIATGNATFTTESPGWDAWDRAHLQVCRLVACDEERVLGWAALGPISGRSVYSGVAEVSVYVAERARGNGIGGLLMNELVEAAERAGLWTLQAGIFPENQASVTLHQGVGFRVVGERERLGCLHGVWRDVLLLERRSAVVGVEG